MENLLVIHEFFFPPAKFLTLVTEFQEHVVILLHMVIELIGATKPIKGKS